MASVDAGRTWRGWAAATLIPAAVAVAFVLLAPREGRAERADRHGRARAGAAGRPAAAAHPAAAARAEPGRPGRGAPEHPRRAAGAARRAASGRRRRAGSGSPPRTWTPGIEAVQAHREGIEVPPPGWAGWYAGGARPGEPGRAVVIGHFDTDEAGGVFERVPSLDRGARIDVTDNRGAVHSYRVVGVTRVRKRRFPTEAVYGHCEHPVLVLVTCGGPVHRGPRVPGQRARVRSVGLMETPPPISFARGAPSLDIVAVDELRAAAQRAFENDPGGTTAYGTAIGYVPLREWIAEYQQVAPEQVVVTNGSMQADAFLFRLARRARRPRDRRGAELRPHAAVAARAGRGPDGDPARGGRRGRRGDRARVRGRRAAEARPHHPQLPQPRRLHAVAREAPPAARPGEDLRLRRSSRTTPTSSSASRARRCRRCCRSTTPTASSTRRRSRRPSAPASASATSRARRR